MPIVCSYKPNRSKPRVFSARDAGRIAAYARASGASTAEILAYQSQALGLRGLWCLLSSISDVLNQSVVLSAMLAVLKGIISISKGIRTLATGRISRLTTSFLEMILPRALWLPLGSILIWAGTAEIAAGSLLLLLTELSSNRGLSALLKEACGEKIEYSPAWSLLESDPVLDSILSAVIAQELQVKLIRDYLEGQ